MRIYADEYKKTHKAQNLYDFSPDSCDLFAIEKQEEMKTFEQNSVTLIQRHNTRLSIRDFHFNTEWQLFYLPIEFTQIILKVQTHTNAFLTRILGSC